MRTIIEPFRFKAVEPIPLLTLEERRAALEAAHYNTFALPASAVTFDLLTDSGTSAMSAAQWAAMMSADEAYAGSASFYRFERAVQEVTGFEQVIPCHQGRAAERILFGLVGGPGRVFVSNTHFDTTRANIEATGAEACDLPVGSARHTEVAAPFKGDLDVAALEALIERRGPRSIAMVIVTVTNNAVGGQPVSLKNLREIRALCDHYVIPLWLDAARFAENAFLIGQREPELAGLEPAVIARRMFELADGCLMSAKKDALVNIGGFLALRDPALATAARNQLILTEGFPSYGGLAGRDLDAIAVGLREVLDPAYLTYRVRSVAYFAEGLEAAGLPTLRPPGGHAVYLDARRALPWIRPEHYPGQALVCALYEQIGIRAVEVGSVMFGRPDPVSGVERLADLELVRLALPRRVYTQSHVDYMIEGAAELVEGAASIRGLRIVWQAPTLRHFTARFERLPGSGAAP